MKRQKPPIMYDVFIGKYRSVTQKDWDLTMARLSSQHSKLTRIRWLVSRQKWPKWAR